MQSIITTIRWTAWEIAFYQTFLETIRRIEAGPELWRKIGENTRRINISRFPYLILYVQHHEDILVTCIAHQHRDPQYYISRTD